jgi:hypothetical protein
MKTAADPETRAADNENEMFAQAGTPIFRKKEVSSDSTDAVNSFGP